MNKSESGSGTGSGREKAKRESAKSSGNNYREKMSKILDDRKSTKHVVKKKKR